MAQKLHKIQYRKIEKGQCFMPTHAFAVIPFLIDPTHSASAEFPNEHRHGLSEQVAVHTDCILIKAPGSYLIYYYGLCRDAQVCPALFLNSRELITTRDTGKKPCGGAIVFLPDTLTCAALTLRLCSAIHEKVSGFIVISDLNFA